MSSVPVVIKRFPMFTQTMYSISFVMFYIVRICLDLVRSTAVQYSCPCTGYLNQLH